MENFKKLIGKKIGNVRRKKGLSQEALAAKLGIDQARVSDWERGKHVPEGPLKAQLLKVLAADETLIDIPAPSLDPAPPQYQPTPEEMSRVYHALVLGIPERRLLGLYLLIGDESYYEQALQLPAAAPIARALKKYPL